MSLENAMKDGFTIDRINNNGNYEIGNLRWATSSEQNLNKRQKESATNEKFITKHRDKFRVRIYFNKNSISLGVFDLLSEAIKARDNYINSELIAAP
jgi:hypothetical protein